MLGARQQHLGIKLLAGLDDARIISGHHDALRGTLAGLLPDVANHRLPGNQLQRLARQTAGGIAGGYHYYEVGRHAYLSRRSSTDRLRASPSSMTGMPSRTGKARASALQINSCWSALSLSGPLHSGQARISSRLG